MYRLHTNGPACRRSNVRSRVFSGHGRPRVTLSILVALLVSGCTTLPPAGLEAEYPPFKRERLSLWGNRIGRIGSLAALTKLEELWLDGNPLSDIGVLAGLTGLRILGLSDTEVSDLAALLKNAGLGEGDEIDLRGIAWSHEIGAAVDRLRQRGATVLTDP